MVVRMVTIWWYGMVVAVVVVLAGVVRGEESGETRVGLTISAQPAQAPADDLLKARERMGVS